MLVADLETPYVESAVLKSRELTGDVYSVFSVDRPKSIFL
jgi:hypothetical protein